MKKSPTKGKQYPKVYIGIDPGQNGAIACVEETTAGVFGLLRIYDMPIIKHVKKTKRRKTGKISRKTTVKYDIDKMIGIFKDLKSIIPINKTKCKVEKIHSLPHDGRQRAFNFGFGYGVIKGILACLGFNVIDVTIPSWKKKFNIKDKEDAMQKARDNVYSIDVILAQQKMGDLRLDQAESMLIAIS